jgi:Mg-chelatase subunit ChlD
MAGDKIIQAKDGASGFVKDALLKGYSTGLIRFASFATHILEPLHKEHPIKEGLSKLTAGGSTNMADGIRLATEKLIDWDARDARVICIVTDGEPDDRNATLQFADEAKQRGIDIITIGTNDADQEFLKKIASRTSLAITVDKNLLKSGIISAAKLLPQRKR